MPASSGRFGAFGCPAGEPPLGPAVLQAPRGSPGRLEAADGVVGIGAERATAVGHDLAVGGQLGEPLLELLDGDRARAVDVAGLELLGGADVAEPYIAGAQPRDELFAADRVDVVAEVVASR